MKVGQKVYFEYGYSLYRGKVIGLSGEALIVRPTTLFGKMGVGVQIRHPQRVHSR